MHHAGPVVDKGAIRARIRKQRQEEPHAAATGRAQRLRGHAPMLRRAARGGTAGYQPTNHEPDISALLRDLSLVAPVYLPRVAGEHLDWVAATPAELVGGHRGIPSPVGSPVARGGDVVTVLAATLMLVPALAVDPRTGARLGYGAGFYDRLLADVPDRRAVLVVGVCRDADAVPLPVEAHDQPMDAILTESGLHRCGATLADG